MKTLFKSLMLVAAAAMAFTSCSKDDGVDNGTEGPKMKLTLRAGNPEVAAASQDSRTELVGAVPYWSVEDRIGVSTNGTTTNYQFTNTANAPAQTTTFSGTTSVSSTIYTYYPYTSNGVGTGGAGATTGAKIDIPVNQNPTATSFDGKADLLVGKPLSMTAAGTTIQDLQFARVGGIIKVVLKDNSTGNKLSDQHVSTLSVTADGTNTLAGRVLLDIVNGKLYEPYYSQSNTVTANYTSATQYQINGTNATYLGVYPRTIATGSKVTIEATTEGYSISKEITLSDAIDILAGKVTTLNITLTDANLTVAATGLALPFTDNFSWLSTAPTEGALNLSNYPKGTGDTELYSATAYTYAEAPALKLGSSSNQGYFTTADLDLSQPFTVVVRAKTYATDESSIQITAGTTVKSATLTSDYKYYTFEFDAQSSKSKIEAKVIGKRGYMVDFQVLAGHDIVLPPVLTITSPATVSALGAGEVLSVSYILENPVAGTSISADAGEASWINTFDYSTPGEISFVVDANTGGERSGVVTISYGDLPPQQITVNQVAGGGTPKEYTVTIDTSNFKALTSGSGYAIFNGDHTFTAKALDGSEYEVVFNTNQFMVQSGKVQGQKNNGVIYNQTNLGKINSVVITTLSGTTTMYEGSAKQPKDVTVTGAAGTYTFSGNNGFMQFTAGSSTVTFLTMTITFTI